MHWLGNVRECCRAVLLDWLKQDKGTYSVGWEVLLGDLELDVAEQLKHATCINIIVIYI